jgi:hypothetical protein
MYNKKKDRTKLAVRPILRMASEFKQNPKRLKGIGAPIESKKAFLDILPDAINTMIFGELLNLTELVALFRLAKSIPQLYKKFCQGCPRVYVGPLDATMLIHHREWLTAHLSLVANTCRYVEWTDNGYRHNQDERFPRPLQIKELQKMKRLRQFKLDSTCYESSSWKRVWNLFPTTSNDFESLVLEACSTRDYSNYIDEFQTGEDPVAALKEQTTQKGPLKILVLPAIWMFQPLNFSDMLNHGTFAKMEQLRLGCPWATEPGILGLLAQNIPTLKHLELICHQFQPIEGKEQAQLEAKPVIELTTGISQLFASATRQHLRLATISDMFDFSISCSSSSHWTFEHTFRYSNPQWYRRGNYAGTPIDTQLTWFHAFLTSRQKIEDVKMNRVQFVMDSPDTFQGSVQRIIQTFKESKCTDVNTLVLEREQTWEVDFGHPLVPQDAKATIFPVDLLKQLVVDQLPTLQTLAVRHFFAVLHMNREKVFETSIIKAIGGEHICPPSTCALWNCKLSEGTIQAWLGFNNRLPENRKCLRLLCPFSPVSRDTLDMLNMISLSNPIQVEQIGSHGQWPIRGYFLEHVQAREIQSLLESCPRLTKLDLTDRVITDVLEFQRIIHETKCPLHSLWFTFAKGKPDDVNLELFQGKQWRSLYIRHYFNQDTEWKNRSQISDFLATQPQLEEFGWYCEAPERKQIQKRLGLDIELKQPHPSLRILDISIWDVTVMIEDVLRVLKTFPQLKRLALHWSADRDQRIWYPAEPKGRKHLSEQQWREIATLWPSRVSEIQMREHSDEIKRFSDYSTFGWFWHPSALSRQTRTNKHWTQFLQSFSFFKERHPTLNKTSCSKPLQMNEDCFSKPLQRNEEWRQFVQFFPVNEIALPQENLKLAARPILCSLDF